MTLSYIRTTPTGVKEYWDSKNKKLVCFKKGAEPGADQLNQGKMIGQYTTSGKTKSEEKPIISNETDQVTNFEDMTLKELRAYTKQHDIDIPSDITKKDDIIEFLSDAK